MENQTEAEIARRRDWRRRRIEMTRAGTHLPTLAELLTGFPFLSDRLTADAQTFAERLLPGVRKMISDAPNLEIALGSLCCEALNLESCMSAAEQLYAAAELIQLRPGQALQRHALRCSLYAASLGSAQAAESVASEAILAALERNWFQYTDERRAAACSAIGWLAFSASGRMTWLNGVPAIEIGLQPGEVWHLGQKTLHLLDVNYREPSPTSANTLERAVTGSTSKTASTGEAEPNAPKDELEQSDDVVVFSAIGNPDTSEGKRIARDYAALVKAPLPRKGWPDMAIVRRRLEAEFPYATQVIATLLDEASMRRTLFLRPTLFVGPPGSGKSRFVERFLEELRLPFSAYGCGGMSDGSIAGTPRRWSNGEPSLPVALIRANGIANPAVILDEVEKAGRSRHNGNMVDALLGMLEPVTARSWHDPYIEAPVDISNVVWLATANLLEGLSAPFRDRWRILRFPAPAAVHLEPLAAACLRAAILEMGLNESWALPLTGDELASVGQFWEGGSVRQLRRLVEGVIAARNQGALAH